MSEKALEEKVEDLLNLLEKKRRKIINEPESEGKFVRLETMDYVIGCVSGIVNRNRKLEKQRVRKEEEEARVARKAKFEKELERILDEKPYVQEYNTGCRHYCMIDDERYCEIDMDMCFCGKNCAYATNMVGSSKVYRSNVVVNHRTMSERRR